MSLGIAECPLYLLEKHRSRLMFLVRCPFAHFYTLINTVNSCSLAYNTQTHLFPKDSNFKNDNKLVLGKYQVLTLPNLNDSNAYIL